MRTRAAAAAAAAAEHTAREAALELAARLNNHNLIVGGASRQSRTNSPAHATMADVPRKQQPTLWLERKTEHEKFKKVWNSDW